MFGLKVRLGCALDMIAYMPAVDIVQMMHNLLVQDVDLVPSSGEYRKGHSHVPSVLCLFLCHTAN